MAGAGIASPKEDAADHENAASGRAKPRRSVDVARVQRADIEHREDPDDAAGDEEQAEYETNRG